MRLGTQKKTTSHAEYVLAILVKSILIFSDLLWHLVDVAEARIQERMRIQISPTLRTATQMWQGI